MNQSDETRKSGALRAMDASINRATEGLRVVEDFARFVLNDRFFSELAKSLRHRIVSSAFSYLPANFICHRDSISDVGASLKTKTEYERLDAHSLVQANMSRAQQAIRSLEEFSKTVDAKLAIEVEQLRYEAYSLEFALAATLSGRMIIANASVYVLIDGGNSPKDFSNRVGQVVNSGVDILQLRTKCSGDRELISQCEIIRRAIRESREDVVFIVNDRPDIARIANADGVHLGQDDLSVSQARTILGSECLIGVSTHSIDQARDAVRDGANYIGVGPVFPSTTKCFDDFPGLDFVTQVANELSVPAFAIGGIDTDNLDQVVEHGIRRVAVSKAIWNSTNPSGVVETFKNKLKAVRC